MDKFNDSEKFQRDIRKACKKIFSGTIKESFLVEMVTRIEKNPRFVFISNEINNISNLLSLESIVIGKGFPVFNICKMIVMCHYANTFFLSDSERGLKQEDEEYKSHLENEVLEMYRMEKIATFGFSTSSLESFLPLIYYVSALANHCGNKYDELVYKNVRTKNGYNSDFNYKMIYKLIMKIKACISLINIGAMDELMIVYRSLIETFMNYCAVWDKDEEIINSFIAFDKATYDYNYSGDVPEEMKQEAKRLKVGKVQYVNYGWMCKLEEYKNLDSKSHLVSLKGLSLILDKKYSHVNKEFGSGIYAHYKSCNPQAHGTLLMINYFHTELAIFVNIAIMLKIMCGIMSDHLFGIDFKIGNVDLVETLNSYTKESREALMCIDGDDALVHKTNIDYRNRIMCSNKMK